MDKKGIEALGWMEKTVLTTKRARIHNIQKNLERLRLDVISKIDSDNIDQMIRQLNEIF